MSPPVLSRLRGSMPILAALGDETRRDLYLFVRRNDRPVTREEAASQSGISVRLAAFHLDKLVKVGLLDVHYARKPGRSGPGAGRTSKYYRPSGLELDVTIPERRYGFLGEVLVAAMATDDRRESARSTAIRIGAERGRRAGNEARRAAGGRSAAGGSMASALETLSRFGYEPVERNDGTVVLRSCPFERLAKTAPEIVCRINHAFVDGVLQGSGANSIEASLEPSDDGCCVRVRAR